jgi:PhnB protein
VAKLSPYIFSEDAVKQAEFYAKSLGGKILDVKTYGDIYPSDAQSDDQSSGEDKNRVMHLVLEVGDETIFMADYGSGQVERGNGMDLTLVYTNEEEARIVFDNLSQGGNVIMPFERMFWGTTFGRLEDPFGIRWQISTES